MRSALQVGLNRRKPLGAKACLPAFFLSFSEHVQSVDACFVKRGKAERMAVYNAAMGEPTA